MKNKIVYALSIVLPAMFALMFIRCKQDALTGVKTKEAVKVYLPDADSARKGVVDGANSYSVDTTDNSVSFPINIYRGGFSDFTEFAVDVEVDNSNIAGYIQSGLLPANTVTLDAADYTLAATDTVFYTNGIMKGAITPRIKIDSLSKYSGKYVALGVTLKSAGQVDVNTSMNKVVLYFNVNDLLDIIAPRKNILLFSKWNAVNLSNSADVSLTLNSADSSMLFTGGNGGYNQMGAYQAVQVKANMSYTIDMNVQGSGMTNCWFEVWITQKQPVNGTDVTTGFDPTAVTLLGINTWDGCGGSAFNTLLSELQCEVNQNAGQITFSTAGTYYITIKSGGNDLGTTGVTAWNIYMK